MSEHTDKVDFIKKVNSWFSELNETVQIYFFNQAFGNENLKFYIIPPHPPK